MVVREAQLRAMRTAEPDPQVAAPETRPPMMRTAELGLRMAAPETQLRAMRTAGPEL